MTEARRIVTIQAREVLDSRGRPTVEAEIELRGGWRASASVPSGASTGRHEALELRDGDPKRHRGLGVRRAVRNIVDEIGPELAGMDADGLHDIDARMRALDGTPDKSRLGANAILAVSLATARVAALGAALPLWAWLRGWSGQSGRPLLPLPMVNVISGGAHAMRNLDLQDFLIIPVGARALPEALDICLAVRGATRDILLERGLNTLLADEGGFSPQLANHRAALDLLMEAIQRGGYAPGRDVALALDVAATQLYAPEKGRYHLPIEAAELEAGEMIELLADWASDYPIVSIEDGLAEDDWDHWHALTERLGRQMQIIGDDLFTTNPERLRRGIAERSANAILVKMNQIGTLSETFEVVRLAREAGFRTVISARSGETEDPALADLAVGSGGGQIKIGSLACSERMAKYNQLLRIAERLGPEADFNGELFAHEPSRANH